MGNIFKFMSISQIIVSVYIGLIIIGGLVLSLPMSSASGDWTRYLDALFTATSALCVTGQVTLNTTTHWSPFGKMFILLLIEVGGLGFITLWMLFFMMRGSKANMRQRIVLLESLNLPADFDLKKIVTYIVQFTLFIQFIGAILLSFAFIPQFGWITGILYGFFHSISAFNNAGFDLLGDSLIGYQTNFYVLFVISMLIIAGGLGFLVWRDLLTYRHNHKLLRYSKLTLIGTATLLIAGFILFILSEGINGTFNHLSLGDFLMNTFFLSVTPRTAGYANIDYSHLSTLGTFITLILMFIGGSSGSIAGGVKVSTIMVTSMFLIRYFTGKPFTIYARTIKIATIRRALFLILAALSIITFASMVLLLTEEIPHGFGIEYILMEVISCLSTVGLTMGLTPNLTIIGKIILIILMLMGRVGLITFLWSIGSHRNNSTIKYPEMNIMIG